MYPTTIDAVAGAAGADAASSDIRFAVAAATAATYALHFAVAAAKMVAFGAPAAAVSTPCFAAQAALDGSVLGSTRDGYHDAQATDPPSEMQSRLDASDPSSVASVAFAES